MRIVVIGTGFGARTMAPAYRALGCDVTVVSPHDEAGVAAAIAGPCDLVSIHSPPFRHLAHVRIAAAHRRAILCDKPFGANVDEARAMLKLAQAAGVPHFVNFEFRHDPLRRAAKALLAGGTLGRPLHVSATSFSGWGRGQSHRWLFEAGKGGWIGAFGSHFVDMLRWLLDDEIARVGGQPRIDVPLRRAKGTDAMVASTAEDAFTAWFRMAGGVTATLDTAFCAAADLPAQTVILCSEGVLTFTEMGEMTVRRAGQPPEPHPAVPPYGADPMGDVVQAWLAEMCAAVARGAPTGPDFADGVACAEVLDALRAAAPPPLSPPR